MGPNGLLTVLAILVAGYTLLSEEKRLDIKLRISWFDRLFVGLLVIAILLVIYSPVILSTGYLQPVGWSWGFTEETMVFSCLSAIIVFFGWKVTDGRLSAANNYICVPFITALAT